jgi:hypothetical protein
MSRLKGGFVHQHWGRIGSVAALPGSSRANAENQGGIDRTPDSKKDRRANADPLPNRLMLVLRNAAGRF